MSAARHHALRQLIKVRREIDELINQLSGDPEHREFVRRELAGESSSTRERRNYDVPLEEPEVIAKRWGVVWPECAPTVTSNE